MGRKRWIVTRRCPREGRYEGCRGNNNGVTLSAQCSLLGAGCWVLVRSKHSLCGEDVGKNGLEVS